jgi:hypothetical protein
MGAGWKWQYAGLNPSRLDTHVALKNSLHSPTITSWFDTRKLLTLT